MTTRIKIEDIKNGTLQKIAKEVDESGVSKKDAYIDDAELSVFIKKANEIKSGFTQKDLNQVLELSKYENTEKSKRASLSWGEIGKTALKSSGNFLKGLFCDENGFSVKRTAATVGVVACLTLAAPVATLLGASATVVGAVSITADVIGTGIAGYMLIDGGKKVVEGTKRYYNAETHEEAQAAMSEAMDGGVEAGVAILPYAGAKITRRTTRARAAELKPANEVSTVNNAKAAESKPIEVKSEENANSKSVENETQNPGNVAKGTNTKQYYKGNQTITEIYDGKGNITSKRVAEQDGSFNEWSYDGQGNIIKHSYREKNGQILEESFENTYNEFNDLVEQTKTDVRGRKSTTKYVRNEENGKLIKTITTYEAGQTIQTPDGKRMTFLKGGIVERYSENGLNVEVFKDSRGHKLRTDYWNTSNRYGLNNHLVKREFAKPDAQNRIKIEYDYDYMASNGYSTNQVNKIIETYADRTTKTTTIEYIWAYSKQLPKTTERFPDGTVIITEPPIKGCYTTRITKISPNGKTEVSEIRSDGTPVLK